MKTLSGMDVGLWHGKGLYMKVFLGIMVLCAIGCSSQKSLNGSMVSTGSHAAFNGTPATYYQIDTVLANVDYSNLLVGSWNIASVKWPGKNRRRAFSGGVLNLAANEKFYCSMGCDTLTGQFTISQNRISFSDIVHASGSCSNSDLDNLMSTLLHVDAAFYQVNTAALLLKDGTGNGLLYANRMR